MRQYFKLLGAFFKVGLLVEMEFRANLFIRVFVDVIWYATQLSLFEVIFLYTRTIGDWTVGEMRVFMGVLFLSDSIYMTLFHENLDVLSSLVQKGDLDFLLLKPVSSQFMVSLRKISVAYVLNIAMTSLWLAWALARLPQFNWASIAWLILMVPTAVAITYSTRFITSASALFFTKFESINYLWHQIYRFAMRPDNIYPASLRYILLSLVPVGFIASVPTRLILGRASWPTGIAGMGVALFFLWLSSRIWTRGLSRYGSASS